MENPIPDNIAGISTLTVVLAWLGSALSLSKQERRPLMQALLGLMVGAFSAALGTHLLNAILTTKLPPAAEGAIAYFLGFFAWQLMPALGERLVAAVKSLRLPWTKE